MRSRKKTKSNKFSNVVRCTALTISVLIINWGGMYSAGYDGILETYQIAESVPDISTDEAVSSYESTEVQIQPTQYTGYTTCRVHAYNSPDTNSGIVITYDFNTYVEFLEYNSIWCKVKYNDIWLYTYRECISLNPASYRSYTVHSSGFKSYMPYTAITAKRSIEYRIQHQYAYTGNYGIRQVDGRYCVAVGWGTNASSGAYIDLILQNGTIIPCVVADHKANNITKSDHLTTIGNGCVSEFIIDRSQLPSIVRSRGDVSFANKNWQSSVIEIRVYEKTIFN